MNIEVIPPTLSARLGDAVRGQVVLPAEAASTSSIVYRLRCVAESVLAKEAVHDKWVTSEVDENHFEPVCLFEIPMPGRGPVSFEGKVLKVSWTLEITLYNLLLRDPKIEIPVHVLPALVKSQAAEAPF